MVIGEAAARLVNEHKEFAAAHSQIPWAPMRGIASLERQLLEGPVLAIVLRYGRFYGSGTGFGTPSAGAPVHIDADADAAETEISPAQLWSLFETTNLQPESAFAYAGHHLIEVSPAVQGIDLVLNAGEARLRLKGRGNGPIAAVVNALGVPLRIDSYEERSLGKGADAQAMAIVEVARIGTVGTRFGVGIYPNIVTASVLAVLSATAGMFPPHVANPVDDLFVDPLPHKRRQRMTIEQFNAVYSVAPHWLRWTMTLAFHLALRRVDLVNLRFDDVAGDRIVSPIRKTDSQARNIEATRVDFPIHPDVRNVLMEARRSSLRVGRCPFIVHREPARRTQRAAGALEGGRMEHPAQVLPEYASKAFYKARDLARDQTHLFDGIRVREMPTLHEIRALSSHLYPSAGYEVAAVQELMAHTDPDMTRAYQKGHARKVLRVEMMLPHRVPRCDDAVKETRAVYRVAAALPDQEIFPENFLRKNGFAA